MAGTFLNEALEHENDIESWLGDLNRMKEEGKTETLIFFRVCISYNRATARMCSG